MRTSLFAIALLAALGCSRPNRASDAGPSAGAAGDSTPRQPGPGETPRDGGAMETDGGDAAMPAPLPPNFVLDCDDAGPGEPAADPIADWTAEREAHGALGRDATFELSGSTYRIEGRGRVDLEAPFTVRTGKLGSGLVTFAQAMVDDFDERGELALLAGDLNASTPREAEASSGTIADLGLATIAVDAASLDGAIDVVTERIGNTDFHRAAATVSDLALGGIYQAYFTPEGSTGAEEQVEWMPSEPVLIHEASMLTFHEEGAGSVQMSLDQPLAVRYEAFGVAGDFDGGSLEIEGDAVRGTPVAVFGRAGELHVGASSIESADGFRITQAVNEAGLVVPAAVEIVPESRSVWVRPSETRVVRLHYRERSYTGDAVLGEIQIGGAASDLLELETRFLPDTLTGDLIDAVIETGWAAPIAAITVLPAVPIVFVIDLFECLFGGCLDRPAPLDPFPQWIEAGAIGTMEVRVKGELAPGTYETSLTFVGRNYCPVYVPLTVHVGDEPPADEDAGANL